MPDNAGKQIVTKNGAASRYRIHLHFKNMVPGAPHAVVLRPQYGEWELGPAFDRALGVVASGPGGGAVSFNELSIGPTTVLVDPTAPARALELQLFLSTGRAVVLGTATLPAGATLSLRSDHDQINVFGKSSWALLLLRDDR